MDIKGLLFVFLSLFLNLTFSNTECPDICFCDDNIQYVVCVGDGLWAIPQDLPETAVKLELRNFLENILSVEDFKDLINLRELKLQQMQITTIEAGTFNALKNLSRLEMNQNLLSSLTEGIFEGLKLLRYLDISSNKLLDIEKAFQYLGELEQLNLRANELSRLTENSFTGLNKVQYLNLDSNKINYIHNETFQYLKSLAHLILSNNPLMKFPHLTFSSTRLQYIDLSRIGIDSVPQGLKRYVRDLRLAKNNLTVIHRGEFDSYIYLGLLVLDDNNITEIENNSFSNQNYLMRLWLNGNKLTNVPSNLPSSLRSLYIEENHLIGLPNYSFRGLIELEQLFLQRNKIENISNSAFYDLKNLQHLDLQANLITILTDGLFANLTSLETLDISQNNIKKIESKCFLPLTKLSTLHLARTKSKTILENGLFYPLKNLINLDLYDSPEITKIIVNSTEILKNLKNVQQLNLRSNNLKNLRQDFPSFFPNLKMIKLNENIWECDQNILWLIQWIKTETSVTFYEKQSILCASPPAMKNKQIIFLNRKDFINENPTISIEITTINQKAYTSQVTIKGYNTTIKPVASDNFTTLENGKISNDNSYEVVNTGYKLKNYTTDLSTNIYKMETLTSAPTFKELITQKTSKEKITNSIVIACVVLVCVILIILVVMIFHKIKHKNNISYSAQTDESDIITEMNTGEGIGNKLYYVVENPNMLGDSNSDTYSNASLQYVSNPMSIESKTQYINGIFP
ncbi:leucine-rich repeat-containing protein 15-like [Centruroides vittatus]|uniref:leucine-rich repeat-containing protein 15-like n=1 Tax=Centruroides vittatus TaxID=120091 RepID=UPI00350EE895